MDGFLWWRDGVIYQIYPRSFSDSNGDGLGDLVGIINHLDYLNDLGIDALWLSPFQPTPDKDFGYDISNYVDVDPRFGTLADFKQLVDQAHRRGIRILLDMVLNHTSDQHAWFQESRSSLANPKRNWYIWRDHPNNWQASFGGGAWELDPTTHQYYLHSFTKEQPDVNWHNPEVRNAMLAILRFWLDLGTDGFRLDVFNAYFKDPALTNNPPKFGLRAFDRQRHLHDMDQPEMMPLLNELRSLLDSYPERYAVGETYLANLEKTARYCGNDKLHAAFSFDFTSNELSFPWDPTWLMKKIVRREQVFNRAGIWPTTVMSNHDLPRAASRYSRGEEDDQAKLAMVLLLTLRGTPYLYYGEELGMRDISLTRAELLDPAGKKYWPIYKGRDGCRSPMQWNDQPFAGFSTTRPWLPVHPDFAHRNAAAQQADPDSVLNFTKNLLRLRKEVPALRDGRFIPVKSPRGSLVYIRQNDHQSVLVRLNFNRRRLEIGQPDSDWRELYSTPPGAQQLLAPYAIQLFVKRV